MDPRSANAPNPEDVLLKLDDQPWLPFSPGVDYAHATLTVSGNGVTFSRVVERGRGLSVGTRDLYQGIVPYILIQLVVIGLVAFYPAFATWLPNLVY